MTTVLNGIGNGMMIGAIPLLVEKIYFSFAKRETHKWANNFDKFALLTTAACAVGGGLYGLYEADRLNDYRESVNEEILKLNNQTRTNAANIAKLGQWSQRIADEKSAPEAAQQATR